MKHLIGLNILVSSEKHGERTQSGSSSHGKKVSSRDNAFVVETFEARLENRKEKWGWS
ncbi:MAG TPA: hypothetical protein VE867_05685 [Candidatus Binatia bacterium]|nr:hypothetical protein [Candidatus Binatia bacterium]